MMSIKEYFEHYVINADFIIFLALTIGLLLIIVFGLYGYTVLCASELNGRARRIYIRKRFDSITERFYEIIFSGGSILLFMVTYYLIDRFMFIEPYRSFWDKYSDFLLLLIIVISILVNRIIDNLLIRLGSLSHEDKASIRLVGMLYMILIFGYIKFIYENNNYDMFISYFLGLMIGRFVYFDVSITDFTTAIKQSAKNLPLMIVALAYLAVLAFYGFKTGYLIKHIGVLTNVLIIHIFMTIAIFVIYNIYCLVNRAPKNKKIE